MSWGLSAYGLSPYGGDSAVNFTFSTAYAVGELIVRVELTRAARMLSAQGVGDALNPRTWGVVRLDNGFVFTVMSVAHIGFGKIFELFLLQKLGASGIDHQISSYTLVDPLGGLIASPKVMTFDGCQAAAATSQASANSIIDLAKTQVRDGSVFSVSASGDYNVESGSPFLRKLFLRRLTTSPGGFFHLTNYGIGLKNKEPLNTSRLSSIKAEVQRVLALEPEVDSVIASIRLSADGVLLIMISAKLRSTGIEVKDTIAIPGVSL